MRSSPASSAALIAVRDGEQIEIIVPDQDGSGALIIPNTVCLVEGGPNPDGGRRLIDYLLSEEVERELAFGRGGQIPVRESVDVPDDTWRLSSIRELEVDYEKVADSLEESTVFLRNLFLR